MRWRVRVGTWRRRRRDRSIGWERNTVRGRSAAGMVDGTLGSASSMSSRWWWRGCERLRWWRNTIVTVRSVGRWMAHSFVARIGNWRGRAVIVWASSGMEEHA